MNDALQIADSFNKAARAVVFSGSCSDFLREIPDKSIQLVVTSPPYNIGKSYETKISLSEYVEQQRKIVAECVRTLKPKGSICWQVGNFVNDGEIVPLDTVLYPVFRDLGMKMRNRIIWHFEHGLHCSRRFSGRYETIIWFTKGDDYLFNLDSVRVPQKYPGKKYFKGPNAGKYSCNPLGKNPGDLWIIPNVKSNHVEKTIHPCQFPVELIERLVLALSNEDDWILDPFLGVGTTIVAATRHNRRGAGAEIYSKYANLARERISEESLGSLRTRPMTKPVFDPANAGRSLTTAPWLNGTSKEMRLFEEPPRPRKKRHANR